MAHRTRWLSVSALALTAALTAALTVTGCTSAPAPASPAPAGPAGDGASTGAGTGAGSTAPALSTAQAQAAFDRYVTTMATANRTGDARLALSVVTGAARSLVAAAIKQAGYTHSPATFDRYAYGTPTFYLPQAGGYPHFFVASAARRYPGTQPSMREVTRAGDAEEPVDGTALLLFEQSSAASSWQLASSSVLASGAAMPRLATGSDGAIPTVPLSTGSLSTGSLSTGSLSTGSLSTGTLLSQPDVTGPLQAAVVDDGPASPASKAVAAGPLTTGMYQGATDHVLGLQPPAGDVYQWDLEGSGYAAFTFRTADGAALVFYSMYLDTLVATPGYIAENYPVEPGPRIAYPQDLDPWIGTGPQRVSVERQDLLSFAAVDPPAGSGKIQVIAVGGGLNWAGAG